jgi:hypothetical protein
MSGCHPSGQQSRQPDGGPEGQIKNYSHDNWLKETELKAALNWSTRRAKGSPVKKSTTVEKGRRLLYTPNLQLFRGVVSMVMRLQMSENQVCQSQVHVTARRYLIFKPEKRGLNSRLRPVLLGGGMVLTHYIITWLETDGQHDTHEGSSRLDPAHC